MPPLATGDAKMRACFTAFAMRCLRQTHKTCYAIRRVFLLMPCCRYYVEARHAAGALRAIDAAARRCAAARLCARSCAPIAGCRADDDYVIVGAQHDSSAQYVTPPGERAIRYEAALSATRCFAAARDARVCRDARWRGAFIADELLSASCLRRVRRLRAPMRYERVAARV